MIRSGRPVWSAVALGERHPVVEPEQVGLVRRWVVLDQHDDVVHLAGDLVGDVVERLLDEGARTRPVEVQGMAPVLADAADERHWSRIE